MPMQTIPGGTTSTGLTVSNGELLEVLSGGVVQSSTVDSGGTLSLSMGTGANDVRVSAGGVLTGAGSRTRRAWL